VNVGHLKASFRNDETEEISDRSLYFYFLIGALGSLRFDSKPLIKGEFDG